MYAFKEKLKLIKSSKIKQLHLGKNLPNYFLFPIITVTIFSTFFSLLGIYTTDFPLYSYFLFFFHLHDPLFPHVLLVSSSAFSLLVLFFRDCAWIKGCWAELLQRMLLGTAFLCWCVGDLGDLSGGGHCGLVSWMSSSIWKTFLKQSSCGGQTTAILLDCGLLLTQSVAVPLGAFSSVLRLLMEYLYTGFSSVGRGAAFPVGGFCTSPFSKLPLDWSSCL